jgi:4'-phosphopantetheinyl transferase
MDAPGWLSQRFDEVADGDAWLGPNELRTLAGLHLERRRRDWLLGRWTAKVAVGAWLGGAAARIEVLAAPDGAPEAWVDGERAPVSLSLSHRNGRALAAVADSPQVAGCDLELVEPRSDAFVREWLAPPERRLIHLSSPSKRPLLANLIWAAKEAGAKVRREGLRLDVRQAVVVAEIGPRACAWSRLEVNWGDRVTKGWWRAEPQWVMVVTAEPAPAVPHGLAAGYGSFSVAAPDVARDGGQ